MVSPIEFDSSKLNKWDKKEIGKKICESDSRVMTLVWEMVALAGNREDSNRLAEVIHEIGKLCPQSYSRKEVEYMDEIASNCIERLKIRKKHMPKPTYQTKQGVKVRSKIEKIIADFYYDNGIAFIYENELCIDNEGFLPDFYLPQFGIYHEHFGMKDDDEYERGKLFKLEKYHGMNFIFTENGDEKEIEEKIKRKLKEQGVDLWNGGNQVP